MLRRFRRLSEQRVSACGKVDFGEVHSVIHNE